jgi:A/G-specific adenine glycosylase
MNCMGRTGRTNPQAFSRSKKAFSRLILRWFEKNRRDFPWRHKTDPYQILIAEIMLQRTKADQVAPVYEDFLREFPTLQTLHKADPERIRKYFASLGLLWRASLLGQMADDMIERFGGQIPSDRDELLSIPAVGDYMADAVLAFAFGQDVAVVDVNVCRVIGRVFGIEWKGEARRKPIFREILKELLPEGKAKEFNWGMIDLGSLICIAKIPMCWQCPLNRICSYARAGGLKASSVQRSDLK